MNIGEIAKTSFLGIVLAFLPFCANNFAPSGTEPVGDINIKIEREWKGYYCGYTEPSQFVGINEDQWMAVWGKVHSFQIPQPQLPKVDFEKEMVIGVFMGVQKSGGYDIVIKKIIKREEEIAVVVEKREPPFDSIQTMALSQPYHIAVIKRFALPVSFH